VLQAVRHVSLDEPTVVVGQEVVDGVAFGDCAHGLDRVDIVVGGCNTQIGVEQTLSNEHQCGRHDELARLGCDQQATFVRPSGDLDNGGFQRSLVQVSLHRGGVAVGATRNQGVSRVEQGHAVATGVAGREAVVQNCSSLDLLGVCHGTSQTLGVASRQAVVQVVFDRFFSDRETQGDGFVVVASRPCFLSVVVSDSSAFSFHWGGTEAGQLGFLFERTLGSLGFVDFLVLFAVLCILQTEQSVQAGEQFFQQLCA